MLHVLASFLRTSLSQLCIKRCPAFVNTFNHSHEFSQFRLALNPATFTNNWLLVLDNRIWSYFFRRFFLQNSSETFIPLSSTVALREREREREREISGCRQTEEFDMRKPWPCYQFETSCQISISILSSYVWMFGVYFDMLCLGQCFL
jgi:hypothetical protein